MRKEMTSAERTQGMTEREWKNYTWKLNRKRQIRNHVILMILTAVIVAGAALSYHMISAAQSEEKDLSFKYYTSIQVASGDSLWSIAEEYCDSHYDSIGSYIDEVVSINHLRDRDLVTAGQSLIVPYYSEEYVR